MSELFGSILSAGAVLRLTGDESWLRALLDTESALARAEADAGVIPETDARVIAAACLRDDYEIAGIGMAATGVGNPAAPLVHALRERVPTSVMPSVHFGATSQDIVDTAAMLVASASCDAILADLRASGDVLADMAERYASTVQIGRTLLQQALPTTFGFTAAGWMSGMDGSVGVLESVRSGLAGQLGGPTGTLSALGDAGPAVLTAFCSHLGLAEPVLPWHTERGRIAVLASALGQACGTVATVARTVTLLAQNEVGEVTEQGPEGSGGSSSMPHKQNPIAAVSALACARQAPGLVATVLSNMEQEYQRAAGAWHAEWRPLIELLRTTGSAAHWLLESMRRLAVHPERMRQHLPEDAGDTGSAAVFVRRALARHRDGAHHDER